MIQRKQTLFLLAAFVLLVVCMFFQSAMLMGYLCVVALVSVGNIFLYKKRKLQANLCTMAIMLLVFWYILLALLQKENVQEVSLEWPAVLPAVSIFLLFLARKGILADEKLVRSLVRLR